MSAPTKAITLRTTAFKRFVAAQAISSFGDWMATIALMSLVLEMTGSSAAVGGVLALRMAPAVFAGPLTARATQRWNRRTTLVTMDLLRAGIVVVIPFIDEIWWVYGCAFVTELAGLVFLPARDAMIPDLVAEEDLPSANGIVMLSSYANIPLGGGAFALISAGFGDAVQASYIAVFAIDAASYLVSAALLRRVGVDGAGHDAADDPESIGSDAVPRFSAALRIPVVRRVLPSVATIMLGVGALFSLGVVYVRSTLGAGEMQFGVLIALFGVGAAAGVGWLQTRHEALDLALIRDATVALGVVLAVMSLMSNLYASYLVASFFGATAAVALVAGMSFLQEQLAGDERTMGLAVVHVIVRLGLSAAAVVSGFVEGRLSAMQWWIVGRVEPASVVMFFAGVVIVLGGISVHASTPVTTTGSAR